jgi:4-amino-4-deoxy-L-arabinose transferase-like glycosyltransferase
LGQDEALTRRHEFIFRLALLILAALLRFGPIAGGLPYISYVDEGHVLHPTIELFQARNFDSTRFTYPPLTSYLTIAATKLYSPIYRLVHHRRLKDDVPKHNDFYTPLGDNYDLIAPPEIIVLGRLVVACLSFGTVLLAGATAKSLAGVRAGLLTILFAAFCPALVSRGSIVIIDTTAAFFAVAALYYCERLRVAAVDSKENILWRETSLAGIAAGLAFGGKYTIGLVFVAVILTIAGLRCALNSKARLLGVAAAGLVIGILFGVPAAMLHPAKIVDELRSQAAFYQSIRSESFLRAALSASEVGIPLLIAGLAGLVAMLVKRDTRTVALSWLGFGVLLLCAVIWPSFHPFRNLLSLIPLLCIAAALLFEQMARYFDRRMAIVAAALLFTASFAWASLGYVRTRLAHVDSRVEAINWLQRNAAKDANILGVRELAILPAEWQRVAGHVVVVPWAEAADVLQQQQFDYIVTGDFDLRLLPDEARWSAYRERWAILAGAIPRQASFGFVTTPVVPYLWRTNDERILILKP